MFCFSFLAIRERKSLLKASDFLPRSEFSEDYYSVTYTSKLQDFFYTSSHSSHKIILSQQQILF